MPGLPPGPSRRRGHGGAEALLRAWGGPLRILVMWMLVVKKTCPGIMG